MEIIHIVVCSLFHFRCSLPDSEFIETCVQTGIQNDAVCFVVMCVPPKRDHMEWIHKFALHGNAIGTRASASRVNQIAM